MIGKSLDLWRKENAKKLLEIFIVADCLSIH